jgi:hypothetical protein
LTHKQVTAYDRVKTQSDQKRRKMGAPYASATSDMNAGEDIKKILRRFGGDTVGFVDDTSKHEVLLAFTHRGRQ